MFVFSEHFFECQVGFGVRYIAFFFFLSFPEFFFSLFLSVDSIFLSLGCECVNERLRKNGFAKIQHFGILTECSAYFFKGHAPRRGATIADVTSGCHAVAVGERCALPECAVSKRNVQVVPYRRHRIKTVHVDFHDRTLFSIYALTFAYSESLWCRWDAVFVLNLFLESQRFMG